MTSKVFFTKEKNKLAELFKTAEIGRIIKKDDAVALKIHFGEPGNNAHLKSDQVKPVFDKITFLGAKPFYTDCNTLYNGPRSSTKNHLEIAQKHGFAPVIISEEDNIAEIKVDLKHFKTVFIGKAAAEADTLIALTHFKGHDVTGFGGSLKNVGMGLGNRRGKLDMHSDCENCRARAACQKKQTIASCWVGSPALVQEKMVEYAFGVIKSKAGKTAHFNFLTDISPNCDCYDHADPPIVPDIGILASFDPVAVDQASVDLVNQTEGRIKSRNKFRALYSNVDWSVQLKYAEEIGLGSRKYELVQL